MKKSDDRGWFLAPSEPSFRFYQLTHIPRENPWLSRRRRELVAGLLVFPHRSIGDLVRSSPSGPIQSSGNSIFRNRRERARVNRIEFQRYSGPLSLLLDFFPRKWNRESASVCIYILISLKEDWSMFQPSALNARKLNSEVGDKA